MSRACSATIYEFAVAIYRTATADDSQYPDSEEVAEFLGVPSLAVNRVSMEFVETFLGGAIDVWADGPENHREKPAGTPSNPD